MRFRVEPLLYFSVSVGYSTAIKGYPIFTWEVLLAAVRSKPASFFARSVRHLNIFMGPQPTDTDNAETVLSLCTCLENLSIARQDRADNILQSLMPTRPLRRLYADPRPLFRTLPHTHSLFSRITHLDIKGPPEPISPGDIGIWARLALLPRLSHLSFMDLSFLSHCLTVLKTCMSLSVLICLCRPPRSPLLQAAFGALAQDVRFVCMVRSHFLKDWQMGVQAGIDYWTHAEDFIARRRSGELDGKPSSSASHA